MGSKRQPANEMLCTRGRDVGLNLCSSPAYRTLRNAMIVTNAASLLALALLPLPEVDGADVGLRAWGMESGLTM